MDSNRFFDENTRIGCKKYNINNKARKNKEK